MTSEERCQVIIRKANLNGYGRGDSLPEAIYWFATQQYLDPEFAKCYFGEKWISNLYALVSIQDRSKKLDYIEQH